MLVSGEVSVPKAGGGNGFQVIMAMSFVPLGGSCDPHAAQEQGQAVHMLPTPHEARWSSHFAPSASYGQGLQVTH